MRLNLLIKGVACRSTSHAGERLCRQSRIEDRLISFAVQVIRAAESLPKSVAANHIAGQLVRCATSPAANYGEAQPPNRGLTLSTN